METLRKALGFSENSGNGEHGDILAIKVAKLMAFVNSSFNLFFKESFIIFTVLTNINFPILFLLTD